MFMDRKDRYCQDNNLQVQHGPNRNARDAVSVNKPILRFPCRRTPTTTHKTLTEDDTDQLTPTEFRLSVQLLQEGAKNGHAQQGAEQSPETDPGTHSSSRIKEHRPHSRAVHRVRLEPLEVHVQTHESRRRPHTLQIDEVRMDHAPECETQNHETCRRQQKGIYR